MAWGAVGGSAGRWLGAGQLLLLAVELVGLAVDGGGLLLSGRWHAAAVGWSVQRLWPGEPLDAAAESFCLREKRKLFTYDNDTIRGGNGETPMAETETENDIVTAVEDVLKPRRTGAADADSRERLLPPD